MMVKRSVLSLALLSTLGSGMFFVGSATNCAARDLDNMEAEKLTYSALVSDSFRVSSHHHDFTPSRASQHTAKRAPVRQVAYHPKHSSHAAIKRAVYHQGGSYLLNRLSHLRLG